MHAKTKKLLITSETFERLVIKQNGLVSHRGHCNECRRDVDLYTLDSAAELSGIRSRRLVEMIVYECIHSYETSTGTLFICGNSLGTTGHGLSGEL